MIAARLATLSHGVKRGDASIEASLTQPDAAKLATLPREKPGTDNCLN